MNSVVSRLLTVDFTRNPCYGDISSDNKHAVGDVPTAHGAEQTNFMFKSQPIVECLTKGISSQTDMRE